MAHLANKLARNTVGLDLGSQLRQYSKPYHDERALRDGAGGAGLASGLLRVKKGGVGDCESAMPQ